MRRIDMSDKFRKNHKLIAYLFIKDLNRFKLTMSSLKKSNRNFSKKKKVWKKWFMRLRC